MLSSKLELFLVTVSSIYLFVPFPFFSCYSNGSLLQLYPAQVSFTSFDTLLSALFQAQEWDTLATLLLAVRKVLHAHNDAPKSESVVAAPSEGSEHGPFLLELSATELRQKVVHFVQLFIGINETDRLWFMFAHNNLPS